ncbi:MAG: hypothetical protein Q4B91_03410 [Atopobiaceae bacterium]|nr:hypothetical protein [Atopobiaceae bacterium]
MGEKMVRSVTVEDVTGVHELGPARAALVLMFGNDGESKFSATGAFSNEDMIYAARTVGLVAGTGAHDLGEGVEAVFRLVLLHAFLEGLKDFGRQAEMCAASALNEMGVGE